MLIPRGTVQQLISSGQLPRVQYRTRNPDASHPLLEWDWSEDCKNQYVFASYEEASEHAAELRADGVPSVYACVVSECGLPTQIFLSSVMPESGAVAAVNPARCDG